MVFLQLLAICSTFSVLSASPTVDLGYAIHQASAPNFSSTYYNFSNIRYAAPPLGLLRFSEPQPPLNNRSAGIQDGSYGKVCPQGYPLWMETALETNNVTYYTSPDLPESEDCLFLDVIVPRQVFEDPHIPAARVLVWIHGGGYVNGDKNSLTNPIGLLQRSATPTVFVSLQYRLGAFGFLASSDFISQGGVPNAGLLDQRAALQWVQKYINVFGGDPCKVTVMGQSMGAGSIMHHITSPDSSRGLFNQAILQSPAIVPIPGQNEQDDTFRAFLAYANATSLAELRDSPSDVLAGANAQLISEAMCASYAFGPTVDNTSRSYVPDTPSRRLLDGHYDHDLKFIVGYNSHEGTLFVNPNTTSAAAMRVYMLQYLPYLPTATVDFMLSNIYPPNSSLPESEDTQRRLLLFASEGFITCNALDVARALPGRTAAYEFGVLPAFHGQDIAYTFYTSPNQNVENETLAMELQADLMGFVKGDTDMPTFGPNGEVLLLDDEGARLEQVDNGRLERCHWWAENF
ncbi:alpha/beta-hydrolase [Lepidopterella palustris CBS 459.81]|uniref:Alpha/beta-hydrolase n=1 Tax=Lepidopterella palustris CBS 459.81 TaxID=1314670 RepID=A0A8E2ECG3_9PEZI|nr:alpha/beta-hydrolase [Lepidopterella palustris CBS 459.81]